MSIAHLVDFLTPAENAEQAVAFDPVRPNLESDERKASLVLLRAVRLAPDLETCEELLRTGRAPISRLDPEWVKAYGLR